MKPIIKNIPLTIFVITLLFFISNSCKKDKLDFDRLSTMAEVYPELAAPLARGEIFLKDFVTDDENTDIDLNAEPITLYLLIDTVLYYDKNEISNIPNQSLYNYSITYPGPDLPPAALALLGDTVDFLPSIDTTYSFIMIEDMRLDSLFLNTGNLVIDVTNNFDHRAYFTISSDNIYQGGSTFTDVFQIPPNTNIHHVSDLSNSILKFNNAADSTMINISFSSILIREDGAGLTTGDNLDISLRFENMNDFEAIFGYIGTRTFNFSEEFETGLEDLEGLEGAFVLTNPQIKLIYTNSFGINMGFNTRLVGIFEDDSVVMSPSNKVIYGINTYGEPEVHDSIIYGRPDFPDDIDNLFTFPPPSVFAFRGSLSTNPVAMADTVNFATQDSKFYMGAKIEVPFELRADLTYRDTLELPDFDSEDVNIEDVDFLDLYYWFTNQFPLGFDVSLILYDSVNDLRLDTINFNENVNTMFLNPAPILADGTSDLDNVETINGVISVNNTQADIILNDADHIIMVISLKSSQNASSVKILSDYRIWFKFGFHTKGTVLFEM